MPLALSLAFAQTFSVAFATPALAQSATAGEAQSAFKAGMSLEQKGDWDGALKKFRDAAAFKSTPQLRFHIGRCLEKLGNWTEAISAYELAMSEATGNQRKEMTKTAKPAAEALRKKVPKLVLERGPNTEFTTVYLDGAEILLASFGQPMVVNPGDHTVKAVEGEASEAQKVTLAEGETKNLVVQAPKPLPAPPAVLPPVAQAAPPPEPEAHSTWLPWTLVGVGTASLAAAGVFVILRRSSINEMNDECGPAGQPCPNSVRSSYDDGKRYSLLANVTGGVGVAALGAGAVMLVLQSGGDDSKPATRSPSPSPSIEVVAAPSFMGVKGRF